MRGATNLQRQLAVLRERYGVVSPAPYRVSLISPPDHDTLILEGVASAPEIDRDRTKFSARGFGVLSTSLPLLIEHDPSRVAGIVTPTYDAQGNLRVRTSPLTGDARRYGAFSIGARILNYAIYDANTPRFYATVTAAELTEVSLTTTPHLKSALVVNRMRPCARAEFYDLMARRVDLLARLVPFIQKGIQNEFAHSR